MRQPCILVSSVVFGGEAPLARAGRLHSEVMATIRALASDGLRNGDAVCRQVSTALSGGITASVAALLVFFRVPWARLFTRDPGIIASLTAVMFPLGLSLAGAETEVSISVDTSAHGYSWLPVTQVQGTECRGPAAGFRGFCSQAIK